jgi:chromosomal replication initiator protein
MTQDFPFGQFLKTNKEAQNTESLGSKNLKEIKITSTSTNQESLTPSEIGENSDKIEASFTNDELSIINSELLNYIKSYVTPQKYNAFFDETFTISDLKMDIMVIQVTTSLIKTMIERNYSQTIRDGIFQILGKEYDIQVNVLNQQSRENTGVNNALSNISEQLSQPNYSNTNDRTRSASDVKFTLDLTPTKDDLMSKVESQYIDHMNPVDTGIIIDQEKSFDNFVIGPSNNLALAACSAISKTPGNKGKYPSLYMYSHSGLGKTHLLHAVANGIRAHFPHYVICLITAREFMKEMINHIKNNNLQEFQKKYSEKVDVLMIDDIHELKNKISTQNELFHVFNELYTKGKQLIFTSDKAPEEIDGIEERIKTRLQWGLVVDIQKPDLETRIAILKKKAYELDLYLQDDILTLIALSIKASIRELEGALIKLSAFADVMKVEIDTEMVKDLLMLKDVDQDKKITLDQIAKTTASYFKIHVADLKSKARQKDIANARFIAMYLSRKIINATQQEIGNFYGNRDHSSVVHAEKEVIKRMATDINVSKDVMTIENSL